MCVLGVAQKTDSYISFILPLILKCVKKCEIWPRFLTIDAFEALWFRNGATHRKMNLILGAPINVLLALPIFDVDRFTYL